MQEFQAQEADRNREIAESLLDILDVETICQKTGLTKVEIEALRGYSK